MVKEEGFLVKGRSPLIAWGEEHLTPRAVEEINGEGDVYEVSRTVNNRCCQVQPRRPVPPSSPCYSFLLSSLWQL